MKAILKSKIYLQKPGLKIKSAKLLFIYFFIVQASFVFAQNYRFESLSTDQGLSQNLVYTIFQDSRHFLWIGTAEGLNRYDGNGFKIYKSSPENSSTISGHHFSSIVEDKEGNLWIGSYGEGLNKYIRKTESFISIKADPKNINTPCGNRITSLLIDRTNHLWIGTETGLSRLELSTGNYKHFKPDINNQDNLCHERVYTLTEDSQGRIWVGTLGGLSVFDPIKNRFSTYLKDEKDPKLIYNDYIHKIYEDRKKNLWVGTAQGLYLFNRKNNTFKKFKSDRQNLNSINDNAIQDILEDSHGNLWIATFYGGLNIYNRDKNVFTHYKHNPFDPTSLSSNVVNCLFEDHSGILWIGTMDGGLCKLDFRKSQFKNYKAEPDSPSSISNNHVSSILVESANSIWVGTLGGGINNLVRKTESARFMRAMNEPLESSSISNNLIYSIHADNKNNLWFGTEGGLAVFNKQRKDLKIYNTQTNSSMINNTVFKVIEDRSGKLWIGTYGGGLGYLDKNSDRFISYTHNPKNPKSIATNIVRNVFEDSRGRMWVCTENGLDCFDRNKNEFIHFKNDPDDSTSIIDNKILLIFESSNKQLWVGTPFGLSKIMNDNGNPNQIKFFSIRKESGLIGNSVQGIQEDKEGNLWISTNDGISKFNPSTNKFSNFDVSDGLLTNEFYVTASAKIVKTGELIFGGNKGLVVFTPEEIRSDEYIPPVAITTLTLSNVPVPINKEIDGNLILPQSITETKTIHLNYSQSEIALEVAALHFANPSGNKFKYKMEGLDNTWAELGNRRFISFTNIDPGNYTLRITAANHNGVWNPKGISLNIIVAPPYWRTIWFKVLMALLGLGIIWFILKYRTKAIEKRSIELQDEIDRRTIELTTTNKQLQEEVAERILIEEKLLKAKETAENASKSKSEFLANMSHELRTPLNAILGYTQIMRKNSDVSDKHKDHLLVIQQSGEHLLTLINDILDLRRIEMKRETVSKSEINLPALVLEVVNTIHIKAMEKQLTFEYAGDGSLPEFILGDAKKIKQILLNLLGNAVKYTKEGFIRLRISCTKNELTALSKNSAVTKRVRFIIEDSGVGIQKDNYEKIFQPFRSKESVKENVDSHGLGLAISKRLVEILGGKLTFHSEVEKGTTFSFELEFELAEKMKEEKKSADKSISGYSGEKKNILIVDDNPTNRLMLIDVLKPLGFNIENAENGNEALDVIKKNKPDIVLLDLLMPEMDGQEFLTRFKSEYKMLQTKVIGISAAIADKERMERFSDACDGFISKPINVNLLLEKMAELLNIEWIVEETALSVMNDEIILPDKTILDQISHLVELGDYSGINQIAKTLSLQNEFVQFSEKLKGYVKNYDDEGILKLCLPEKESSENS